MPEIALDHISKKYGPTTVIDEFDAVIEDKEFLVLLGPSGCGKSTMLRMIAGLTEISGGSLRFDGEVVNDHSPKKRNIAFVFQSYALYPHMSVRANIAFPLIMDQFRWWWHVPLVGVVKRRSLARQHDVSARVDEVAEMLELTEYLDRRPRALSGGQRQRVALARALVREPSLYLLDEPLSNLDAKLRTQMRAEITALHDRVQKTFIYVTHDQVEAMTMGTRIIVLDKGVVQQYGTPKEIYDRPESTFVATFIGAPPMNLLTVELSGSGVAVHGTKIPGTEAAAARLERSGHTHVLMGVRPEKVRLEERDDDGDGLPAAVAVVEHLGAESVVGVRLDGQAASGPVKVSYRHLHYARLPGDVSLVHGDRCRVDLDLTGVSWFDADTGLRIADA